MLISACALWAQQGPDSQKPQKPSSSERQSESTTTLKVNVNLVNVFVTVTDPHGAPVGGLTRENFVLKEDDSEQTIKIFAKESALPLSIALAVDTSLSTRHDLPLEQASAKRFAHEILRPVDALSVYALSETVHAGLGGGVGSHTGAGLKCAHRADTDDPPRGRFGKMRDRRARGVERGGDVERIHPLPGLGVTVGNRLEREAAGDVDQRIELAEM